MFSKISSITLAILLFLTYFGSRDHHYIFALAVVFMIAASLGINFKRLNFTWPHLMLPVLYLVGVASLFVLIPNFPIQVGFLIVASAIFYFLEVNLGHESHFLQNIFLLSVFAWFLGLFAIEFYIKLPVLILIFLVFSVTYLFGIQGFAGFSLPAKKYFYFLLALICAEAAWGLSFWPTLFFVNALVLFCIFYLLWLFAFSAFFGKLSKAKIYWQVTLVLIVLILILITTPWRPIT